MGDFRPSIVRYRSEQKWNRCGYCSTSDGSHVYGLSADTLRPEDYQNMLDRGWRRSGSFSYKSIMETTCCPSYTIRCSAKDFKLSKTQKKIIKRFNNFLVTGKITKDKFYGATDINEPMETFRTDKKDEAFEKSDPHALMVSKSTTVAETGNAEKVQPKLQKKKSAELPHVNPPQAKEQANKNKCMKAKYLRIERKRQKLQKLGLSEEEISKKLVEKKKYPIIKTIEDYLNENSSDNKLHSLKIKLVRIDSADSKMSLIKESALLYAKYQKAIHHESDENCGAISFYRFLLEFSLEASENYGSYHQQYWLDNKLIAVGVIDILPKCVSSVYFFYDPDYTFLSLGTYGALREIEFTRKLSKNFPDLCYYYMGLYIHSCIKMKYKGAFKPSYLLCPKAYTWHPIEECVKKIEISKYTRLNDDLNFRDEDSNPSPSDVLILYQKTVMTLVDYMKRKKCTSGEIELIMEYARLLGKKCTRKMLLFRK